VSTAITPGTSAAGPPEAPPLTPADWDRLRRRALVAAGGGAVGFAAAAGLLYAVGQLPDPRQLFLSYLTAWVFWLGVPAGCLVVLMMQHLTGGAWGLVLRRTLEAATRTLPLLALLAVPVLAGVPYLYEWYDPHPLDDRQRAFWEHKHLWLNWPGFVARAVVYFAVWIILAFILNRWSRQQEHRGSAFPERRFRLLSGPGLVLYGAAATFASVDWLMSLEPDWYSTIYPVLFAIGQLLTGFAFALAAVMALNDRPPFAGVLGPAVRRDLGNLLLAFVMFWAYISISQLLLQWVGNLPEEIPWYLRRSRGGWQVIAALLAIFHFAVPFLCLLSRDVKEDPRWLRAVALWLLAVHFLDVFWWVEPAYPHDGQYFFWLLDLAAAVCLGGLLEVVFLWQLRRHPLLPAGAAELLEAARHE
jgi:hypothetical protein